MTVVGKTVFKTFLKNEFYTDFSNVAETVTICGLVTNAALKCSEDLI